MIFLNSRPCYNQIITSDLNNFKFQDLCDDLGLLNLIFKPTRKNRTLDFILIPEGLYLYYRDGIFYDSPLDNADHCMIPAIPNSQTPPAKIQSYHTIYDYRQSHLTNLINAADRFDWIGLVSHLTDVDAQWKILHDTLTDLIQCYIPTCIIALTYSDKDWITPLTKALKQ